MHLSEETVGEDSYTEAKLIRIAIVGAAGEAAKSIFRELDEQDGVLPVLAIDHHDNVGRNIRDLVPGGPDLVIEDKLGAALDRVPVDVLIDFSHHSAVATHAGSAVRRKIPFIIGSVGVTPSDVTLLRQECEESGVAGIYAPNLALGQALMMKFMEMAARWMPHAEIIEMHADRKGYAPSTTAIRLADRVVHGREAPFVRDIDNQERLPGCRGATLHDVHIHSVRLPGLVSHQMAIFGSQGEALTIKHDMLDCDAILKGLLICIHRIQKMKGLTIGLDALLFEDDV